MNRWNVRTEGPWNPEAENQKKPGRLGLTAGTLAPLTPTCFCSHMVWLIMPPVSLQYRSMRCCLPCIRKIVKQDDNSQQESGYPVAGSLANGS
jgi:hypothetical protein